MKDKAIEMDLEKEQNSEVAEMDIDNQQSAEAEVVVAADKELKDVEPEASVDLKAWMAKQEEVTSELQKTTTELQQSSAEMKTWMMQQGETSSKIESLLAQLLAKNALKYFLSVLFSSNNST